MNKATLRIEGMSCGHCVVTVRSELAKQPGVQVEEVTVGSATVAYDPDVCSPAQLADAVAAAGYEARASA